MSQRITSFFKGFGAIIARVCASLAQLCATRSVTTLARVTAVSAVLLAFLAPAPAFAQDARIQEIEGQVIASVLRFVDALEAGNAAALEEAISAETPAQVQTRAAFARIAAAQKALERAAAARFGPECKRFRCGFDIIVGAGDRKAIGSAKIYFDPAAGGRAADVEKPGELSPMRVRMSDDGRWQVVLEPIDMFDPAEGESYDPYPRFAATQPVRIGARAVIRLARYNAMIGAFDKTRAGIESGTLATPAAAETELNRGIVAAAA